MAVAHLVGGEGGVFHAGDVDQAGVLGEKQAFARQVVVEGVVHQLECVAAANLVDGAHGLRLAAHGAFFKAQGFHQADQTGFVQQGLELGEGVDQIEVALVGGAVVAQVVGGAEHQGLGTAGHGVGNHVLGFLQALGIELLETLQRVDGADGQALELGGGTDVGGLGTVDHFRVGQVVADFDGTHAQALGHGGEGGEGDARCADAVDGKRDGGCHGVCLLKKMGLSVDGSGRHCRQATPLWQRFF